MTTVRPMPADPVLAPLLRARPLPRRSGSFVVVEMAKKPALAAIDPEMLSVTRRMADVLAFTMANFQHADGRIGVSNVELARWIGRSESIIRGWKSRNKPIPTYHLMKLPEDFREALLAAWHDIFNQPVENDTY
jgi:hypothetical protein